LALAAGEDILGLIVGVIVLGIVGVIVLGDIVGVIVLGIRVVGAKESVKEVLDTISHTA